MSDQGADFKESLYASSDLHPALPPPPFTLPKEPVAAHKYGQTHFAFSRIKKIKNYDILLDAQGTDQPLLLGKGGDLVRPIPSAGGGELAFPFLLQFHPRRLFSRCYFPINNPNHLGYSFSFARISSSENTNNNDKYLPQLSVLSRAPFLPTRCNYNASHTGKQIKSLDAPSGL